MVIRFAAKRYIDQGWHVVPLVAGQKRAASSWQKKVYAPDDFNDGDGIALKLGEPSGWLVDVALDCPEAVEAAKLLMPDTGLRSGRPGKLSSHLWFRCPDIKTTQFTDTGAMLVEIRSTGGYTCVPPSTHPSGDVLAWESERAPMTIESSALYECVRDVAIVAMLARHWPGHGATHSMVGPLAGFLCQAGVLPDQVIRIIETAAVISKADVRDVKNYVTSTVGKFKKGEKVTGGPRLIDTLGEAVVAKLRGWLHLADIDAIEAMNARHFFVRMGSKSAVGREDDPRGIVFQPVKELYPEYANHKIVVGEGKDGEPKLLPVYQAWLESKVRRSYTNVIFAPPPLVAREEEYNLWKGFAIEPVAGRCDRFLEHMHEVICAGNDEYYRYLIRFCAYALQSPGTAAGVAVVMRGRLDTGKGTMLQMFSRIIGPHHYAHLDRSEELVKWNSLISGKVVVFADEAFFAGDKEHIGSLKRLITEPTIRVSRKFLETTEEPNCIHLFMATNEDWSVPAGLGERRFFCLDVSDKHEQSEGYFAPIYQEMADGGAAAFLHEMLQVPVTAAQVRACPKTAELRRQQDMSMPLHLRWLQECLWEGKIGAIVWDNTWIPTREIYLAYQAWVREHNGRTLDIKPFSAVMHAYLSAVPNKPRNIGGDIQRCTELYSLDDARKVLDASMKTTTEWPDAQSTSGNIPF